MLQLLTHSWLFTKEIYKKKKHNSSWQDWARLFSSASRLFANFLLIHKLLCDAILFLAVPKGSSITVVLLISAGFAFGLVSHSFTAADAQRTERRVGLCSGGTATTEELGWWEEEMQKEFHNQQTSLLSRLMEDCGFCLNTDSSRESSKQTFLEKGELHDFCGWL